jgi:Zn-dependent protease with chaperone function
MASFSSAGRAFGALLALAAASLALLLGLVWWQIPHLAQGVWLVCQSAAQAVEGYLPLAGLLLPVALLVMGVLRGLSMLASQLWYTRLLVRDLGRRSLPMPDGLAGSADSLHLGGLVTVVADVEAYAFAAGLARSRIWLSSGLLALLDEAELAAVLRHERHHLVRRDPLRVLLARSLAHGLFFVPVASVLRDRYMEAKEREADAASGANHELAAALLKLMRAGSPLPSSASLAAAGSAPTARRILRLLGREPETRTVDRALLQRLIVSLALAAALWTVSTVSLSQAASPLTGGECGYTTTDLYSTPANFTPHSATSVP